MVWQWLRRLGAGPREPDQLPGMIAVDTDPVLGLRASKRLPVQVDAGTVRLTPADGGPPRKVPITVTDLSNGGARVVCTEALARGDTFPLRFKLPRAGGDWHGRARVTWVSPTGMLAGVAFEPPANAREQAAWERLRHCVALLQAGAN